MTEAAARRAEARADAKAKALTPLQAGVARRHRAHRTPSRPPAFRQLCFPRVFKVQNQQAFLGEHLGPGGGGRGVLAFHVLGAGKTCAAIRVAEAWRGKGRRAVVVLPASLVGNFYRELAGGCGPRGRGVAPLDDPHYTVMSVNRFVKLARESPSAVAALLRGAVLIVDEVQNVVSETGANYKAFEAAIAAAPADLRVVLLSATPIFDKPVELALTLNLLRPATPFPVGREFERTFLEERKGVVVMRDVELFRRMAAGLVSFFPGAPPAAFPRASSTVVRCPMSAYQYASYLAVEEREGRARGGAQFRDMRGMPNDFLIGSRTVSNVAFPERAAGRAGLELFRGAAALGPRGLARHSCKMAALLERLDGCAGTAFVYSNFRGVAGLETLARALEHRGFRAFPGVAGHPTYATWTGADASEAREAALAAFNDPANAGGSRVKVMLASPAGKEGLNLLRCAQVHLLDPYWNTSREEQVVGRAVRFCSHKDVPGKARKVDVFRYLAVAPVRPGGAAAGRKKKKMTADEHIHDMARAKHALVVSFYRALREAAVDRGLFQRGAGLQPPAAS